MIIWNEMNDQCSNDFSPSHTKKSITIASFKHLDFFNVSASNEIYIKMYTLKCCNTFLSFVQCVHAPQCMHLRLTQF